MNIDILLTVLSQLDARDLAKATATCRQWARSEQRHREELWREVVLREFGPGEVNGWIAARPWKVKYRLLSSRARRPCRANVQKRLEGYEFGIDVRNGELDEFGSNKIVGTSVLSLHTGAKGETLLTTEEWFGSEFSCGEDGKPSGELWLTIYARRFVDDKMIVFAGSSIDLNKCRMHGDTTFGFAQALGCNEDPEELLPIEFNERQYTPDGHTNVFGQELLMFSLRHSVSFVKMAPSQACWLLCRVDTAINYRKVPHDDDSDSEDEEGAHGEQQTSAFGRAAAPVSPSLLLSMLEGLAVDWA